MLYRAKLRLVKERSYRMRGYDYGLLCLTPLSRILQLSYIVAVSLFVEESHEHVESHWQILWYNICNIVFLINFLVLIFLLLWHISTISIRPCKILKNRLTPRLYKCYYHSTVTNRWYVTTQCINTYEDIEEELKDTKGR
jgi:hypothetical protein